MNLSDGSKFEIVPPFDWQVIIALPNPFCLRITAASSAASGNFFSSVQIFSLNEQSLNGAGKICTAGVWVFVSVVIKRMNFFRLYAYIKNRQ